MPTCWKRKLIRIKRIVRVTLMVLICGLLGLTFWFPFSFEHIIRWLPMDAISELTRLNKSTSQIAAVLLTHFGIIGYAFHRLPKKNQYARESVKKKKIAAIVVSAIFVFLEAGACFAVGISYLLELQPVIFSISTNYVIC